MEPRVAAKCGAESKLQVRTYGIVCVFWGPYIAFSYRVVYGFMFMCICMYIYIWASSSW